MHMLPVLILVGGLGLDCNTAAASSSPGVDTVRGVSPGRQHLYTKSSTHFACLDGSKTIPLSRVNDDYCDCPDGSDEPGTAACPNSTFYCANDGHIPVVIPASHVNDGNCDPVCCDGSDEWAGLVSCPNVCKQQAKEHAKIAADREAIRSAGYAKRQAWVKEAARLRKDVQDQIDRKRTALADQRARLAVVERELSDLEANERERVAASGVTKSQDEVNAVMSDFNAALTALRSRIAQQQKRIDEYQAIVDDLAQNYNPNFQDMAVKGAVTAFNDLPTLPDFVESETAQLLANRRVEISCPLPELPPQVAPPENFLTALLGSMRTALESFGILQASDIEPAFPASGSASSSGESRELSSKREVVQSLKTEVDTLERGLKSLEDDLNGEYGADDIFRATMGKCFEKRIGEYDYEVCLRDVLRQKSSSSQTLVGNFVSIDTSLEDGITRMRYANGQRCWNGPDRSGIVELICGKENELISVREAQKCEYVFLVKTPAVCGPPSSTSGHVTKDEL
ncbi:hypothetical protein PYCC9005_000411 [Savitreella phatthalungensis]